MSIFMQQQHIMLTAKAIVSGAKGEDDSRGPGAPNYMLKLFQLSLLKLHLKGSFTFDQRHNQHRHWEKHTPQYFV